MDKEDQFLKRLFAEGEEKPRSNITEKVMHRIDQNSKAFEYEPVISKKAWIVIGSLFSVAMIYLLINSSGVAYTETFELISNGFFQIGNSLSFEFKRPSMPHIPSSMLISIAAINVIGVYFIISFRWRKWMFRA